ncbi:transglutaminase family protein [Roseomonas sp. CCTCC AB2023176]|uniref:transglutaminase-like domain-containing protein n=1 Tax=Roseomonas sp. CCTCC AB2023176 TaxID=3342640 RepID=UPI0035D8F960
MKILAGCDLSYRTSGPATLILNVQPARQARQAILRETLTISPEDTRRETWEDPVTGNRYLRLHVAGGVTLRLVHEAEVELTPGDADPTTIRDVPVSELPPEVLPHLWPSRYCESDRLERLARREFCDAPNGHARVTAICNWVNDRIAYVSGASQPTTTATETLLSGAGVCRDFAHLSIALCRALGIPARFVSAHAPGLVPPDFHAVFEAWLGDRWWLFDATRQAPLDALVRIGQGRDAAEAAFAELHGPIVPEAMQVHAQVVEGPDPATAPRTTAAIAA